jgi:N-methylhydantoinase B
VYGKVARCKLRRGDIARLITATGGGYGDPRRRAPERVRDDARNGFISAKTAEQVYGVTLEPALAAAAGD